MATLVVTTLDDHAGPGRSLREAVKQASNGDTMVFAHDLLLPGFELQSDLHIDKSTTIDGSPGGFNPVGGLTYIQGRDASVIIGAGAQVTLQYLQTGGGSNGPSGGDHGSDGIDGTNGGKSPTTGFIDPRADQSGHADAGSCAGDGRRHWRKWQRRWVRW